MILGYEYHWLGCLIEINVEFRAELLPIQYKERQTDASAECAEVKYMSPDFKWTTKYSNV